MAQLRPMGNACPDHWANPSYVASGIVVTDRKTAVTGKDRRGCSVPVSPLRAGTREAARPASLREFRVGDADARRVSAARLADVAIGRVRVPVHCAVERGQLDQA